MAKDDKYRTRFRITLREVRNDVNRNLRRIAKGSACVVIGKQYGEVLLTVENLKYLGVTPQGAPYYYEGWMILANGYEISMGPVSVDDKGEGRGYWRFAAANTNCVGIKVAEIAGFAVTVALRDNKPYMPKLVVLSGMISTTGNTSKMALEAGCANSPGGGQQGELVNKLKVNIPSIKTQTIDSWWPVWPPGVNQKETPFLFGCRMGNAGIEDVIFGFPGFPDQPVLTGKWGEWQSTGMDNPPGYWIYPLSKSL